MSRYLDLLRLRPFRLYWLGFAISALGNELTIVAFVWFVYDQTRSAEAVGWLMACFTGPIVIGAFLAGWVLDRFDRRRILIVDNCLRAVVVGAVPVLHLSGALALWHLYAAAATYGFLLMIPLAGTPAMIPSLVPPDKIAAANAMEMLGFTVGSVAGPVLGGLLIAAAGAPLAVAVDAASYLLFAFCLWRMGPVEPPVRSARQSSAGFGFGAAVDLLFGNPVLLATTMMFLTWNIGAGMISVWLPILVREHIQGGRELYGTLVGIQAAGQMASTLVVGAVAADGRLGLRICLIQAASGLVLPLLALLGQIAPILALALAAFGACSAPLTIWAQTLRMRLVPAELRGRAFALMRMLMQSGRPIGGALGGAALPVLGIGGAIVVSAGLTGVPGALGLLIRPLRGAAVPTKPETVR
jgi:MFS family permease